MAMTHDYILEKDLEDHQAFFTFTGKFKNNPVIWHVHLVNQQINPENTTDQQYLKIFPSSNNEHMNAEIYLKILKIRPADILKSIIMLSQYKNLNIGTHYYGQSS